MSELISQVMTTELRSAILICIIFVVLLYVLSVIWVARDASLRGANWKIWAVIALIPAIGVVAYCLMRPPLMRIDQAEQELEIAFKQRELQRYGECGSCGKPIESDYILCPYCHQRLKNLCPVCHRALDPQWSVCPYCATGITASSQPYIPDLENVSPMSQPARSGRPRATSATRRPARR